MEVFVIGLGRTFSVSDLFGGNLEEVRVPFQSNITFILIHMYACMCSQIAIQETSPPNIRT